MADTALVKPINLPLVRHEMEVARAMADLHTELIVEVADMSLEAAQYIRQRPWMTPELPRKWGVGWIAGNGRSLFRKIYLVYTHRNEHRNVGASRMVTGWRQPVCEAAFGGGSGVRRPRRG